MKVLRVKNWEKDFESAKSKTYNHRSQFYCPNKHGLGYQRILASQNGEAVYGCWQAMCQVLSRQEKPRHGYLTDTAVSSGRPWTAADVALVTRYSEATCQQMLDLTSSELVGWLEVVDAKDTTRTPQETAKEPQYRYPSPLPLPTDTEADTACGIHGYPTPASQPTVYAAINTPEINAAWNQYVPIRATMKGKRFPIIAAEMMLRDLNKMGPDKALRSIQASIKSEWPNVYDPDDKRGSGQRAPTINMSDIVGDSEENIRKALS